MQRWLVGLDLQSLGWKDVGNRELLLPTPIDLLVSFPGFAYEKLVVGWCVVAHIDLDLLP